MDYFKNSNVVTLPIQGSNDHYYVNHVFCVGRNYKAHAIEMGADDPNPPFFFSKPNWAIVPSNSAVEFPIDTKNVNFEVELVIAMGENHTIFGFGVGIDLTRRDIQGKAKEEGKPWFRGKCFKGSAPVSNIIPIGNRTSFNDISIVLSVNGNIKQSGSCTNMIWDVNEIIHELVKDIPLNAGDLIFTGTPEGVGKTIRGDSIIAAIPGIVELDISII